ncbi:hypothetical protein ATANTOWER_028917 [Ataeniobius toweri]|uniref:Uncharacterized protein n=1 Tax=Ataeniobius toweri TaxID=208326 RepID=A0ABU7AV91_9TELE|nr:hypothetical protein [Ataeniobius toweri]
MLHLRCNGCSSVAVIVHHTVMPSLRGPCWHMVEMGAVSPSCPQTPRQQVSGGTLTPPPQVFTFELQQYEGSVPGDLPASKELHLLANMCHVITWTRTIASGTHCTWTDQLGDS